MRSEASLRAAAVAGAMRGGYEERRGSAMEELVVRKATPEDIDEAVAIDDDAGQLFSGFGLHVELGPGHPFAEAERARWLRATRAGNAFLAAPAAGPTRPAHGLLVLGRVDGEPYLEQLSVRSGAMRRGLGTQLLHRALEWAAGEALWLTTYAHVPWNRPFYERFGFAVVPESSCGGDILEILAEQRRWLPAPEQRVAMRQSSSRPGRR